jgi:ribosomal protein L37E
VKWRCTWCGKPHAENDPPCDACGHNTFEKAVVRVDDETQSGTESGVDTDAGFGSELTESGTVDTGPDYVWACPNCGREHVRNTPPCSRCGNPDLERVEQTYEGLERDLETPSWFAVAKPYLPILVVMGVIVALFATGIVSPSILPGIGPPSPPDAPGEGTEAAGIDLEATEGEIHDRLEDERESSESRTHDDGLAAYAEYQNRGLVAMEFDDREPEAVDPDEFDPSCGDSRVVSGRLTLTEVSVQNDSDESAFGDAIAEQLLAEYGEDMLTGFDAEGFDVHRAPNGDVFVFYAAC